MGIFRKKETYNEQMLREAGLDRVVFNTPQPGPIDAGPLPGVTGEFRVGQSEQPSGGRSDSDTTTTATAPDIEGDYVAFIALPNGDLILTSEDSDGDLSPLADAVEEHVSAPYRARASRQEGDLWVVGATGIEVGQFSFPDADAIELAQSGGVSEFDVDGEPSDATAPLELQRLGERVGGDFCVGATRIDGDYWEVMVGPL